MEYEKLDGRKAGTVNGERGIGLKRKLRGRVGRSGKEYYILCNILRKSLKCARFN